jgi:SAM-dependent methyltransferase
MSQSSTILGDTTLPVRDRILGPSLLYPFAEDMARRMVRLSTGPLLEIAADTGVMTQSMAHAMAADLTIIATDPDPAAIERAATKPGMARIAWQRADPRALPFRDATFGIVASLFAPATMPDRVQAFREARRVLRTGGRFLFAVPAHLRHTPVANLLNAALAERFPASPPDYLSRGLFGYADNEAIDDDLTEAGFTDAVYTSVDLPFAIASARDAATGFCLGTPLHQQIEARAPGQSEEIAAEAAERLARKFGHGAINATMRAHVVSASG